MRKHRNLLNILISLLVLVAGGTAGAWYWLNQTPAINDTTAVQGNSQCLNILLLGSDSRPGEQVGNTDTIIVARLDNKKLTMLSIPRDTRVEIPGHGYDKINAACRIGGPKLTAKIVSDLIGEPVDNYAMVRWDGFMKIVDTLGGVTVDVPRTMSYDPGDGPDYVINLKKGVQHLDGRKALAFVRFRKEALGDIGRTSQQLAFLKAFVQQAQHPGTILKLPWLMPELYQCVDTNLNMPDLLALAKSGKNLEHLPTVAQTLPGYFFNYKGASYWAVDTDQVRQVAYDLFTNGETTDKIVLDTPPDSIRALVAEAQQSEIKVADQTGKTSDATSPAPPVSVDLNDNTGQVQTGENTTPGTDTQSGAGTTPSTGDNTGNSSGTTTGNSGNNPPGSGTTPEGNNTTDTQQVGT